MSTAFNLERAKAGEPIVRVYGTGKNEPVLFIGAMSDGQIAVEFPDRPGEPYTYSQVDLAMAPPKPVTIWVVTWWFDGKPDAGSNFWFPEKEQAEAYAAAVKIKYGQPGNKWDHPVITPVEVQP